MNRSDFLVIGGGVAGLTYALEVAEHGSVTVLFKKELSDSSTAWAQGGIAAVSESTDSFESHLEDTIQAGAGLCKREVVDVVVHEGPSRVQELISLGANFDKEGGGYHLHQEGGHTHRRILHAADQTGWEILRVLLKAARAHPNIEFLPSHFAIDLITTARLGIEGANRVMGAYVLLPNGEVEIFRASRVLVATGGAGKVYLYTSNPDVASGDGIAMCYRAGLAVANMEFFQFHPTCLFHPKAKNFLITEALRGEGGVLKRIDGTPFMSGYDPRAELAPRDVVARAIDSEMKRLGDEYVCLDVSHREPEFLREHFPHIYEQCLQFGYDLTAAPIPVVPAAHYCCGGVVTDEHGRTAIQGLYAAGECAHTGLHGANRLASNSLLEGLVFATRAARDSRREFQSGEHEVEIPAWDPGHATDSDEQVVILQNWEEIRRLMWNYVGIVRTTKRLERALARNSLIRDEIETYYWDFTVTADLLELRNLSLVAEMVIRSALSRKESRGLHFTLDYPDQDGAAAHDTVLQG